MSIIGFEHADLPLKDSIDEYVATGRPVGSFLTALLSNDLMDACGLADSRNILLLPVYCSYLYNECPSQCYGSPEKVRTWLESRAKCADQQ